MSGEKNIKRGDTMKKILKIGVTFIVLASVCATSVFAAPSVNDLKSEKNKAQNEMKSLEQELTGIMAEMNKTEQKLIAKGEAIIEANQKLEQAKENEAKQQSNMTKRIVTMYENGNDNFLTILLEAGNLSDLLKRIENVQIIHNYDREELKKFVETRKEIAALSESLQKEQSDLENLQTQLASQERSLNNKIKAKKDQIANFDAQIAEAARKAAEEAAQNQGQGQVIVGGSNSSGGRPYTGTGDRAVGNAIVEAARSYIGVWYLWGGNDRNGIDCSGLTKAAHKAVGINIDRWSGHQAIGGKNIGSLSEALPGDIICYPGHVAIYIGNNRIIHAPTTGKKVQEASVYLGGVKPITAIRRYW